MRKNTELGSPLINEWVNPIYGCPSCEAWEMENAKYWLALHIREQKISLMQLENDFLKRQLEILCKPDKL